MEMGAGHPPRRAHVADQLAAGDGVAGRDEGTAEVQIAGDQAGPVATGWCGEWEAARAKEK